MTKGLVTRIIVIGTLTGLQWWIYDTSRRRLASAPPVATSSPKRLKRRSVFCRLVGPRARCPGGPARRFRFDALGVPLCTRLLFFFLINLCCYLRGEWG
jgi:hypothetical protein